MVLTNIIDQYITLKITRRKLPGDLTLVELQLNSIQDDLNLAEGWLDSSWTVYWVTCLALILQLADDIASPCIGIKFSSSDAGDYPSFF